MTQLVCRVSPHDHPDSVLRSLGLIRQRIRRAVGASLIFNPFRGWMKSQSMHTVDADPRGANLSATIEFQSIFFVLGSIIPSGNVEIARSVSEVERFLTYRIGDSSATQGDETSRARVLSFLRHLVHEGSARDIESKTFSNVGDVELDGKFLDDRETERFILQYLVRGLPMAARATNALVGTAAQSDLLAALVTGIERSDGGYSSLYVGDIQTAPVDAFSHVAIVEPGDHSTRHDQVRFCWELLRCLSERGPGIPLVGVLFGGHSAVKFDLLEVILSGCKVVVVEGSGGYADHLASLTAGYHEALDIAAFLSHLDAETARILQSSLVTIVPKGTIAEQFAKTLEYSAKRDATLQASWGAYHRWQKAGKRYEWMFKVQMIIILCLGIISTGLSIFQTLVQLLWPNAVSSDSDEWPRYAYTALNIVIIVLPIMMQLAQTITTKLNAGGKWAAFRGAADKIFSDIYCMRAGVGRYAPVELDQSGASRQGLLASRLEALTVELNTAVPDGASLETNPPAAMGVLADGDDGYSDLSSADYVRFRVAPLQSHYLSDVKTLSRTRRAIEGFVHTFNTIGTLLAALATATVFTRYNLQAWVAFTTALVSAFTRYEHWMMLDWRLKKYNETAAKLFSLEAWWSSRGSLRSDDDVKLVVGNRSESIIGDELTEFVKQLRNSSEGEKQLIGRDQDQGQSGVGALQKQYTPSQVQVDLFTPANILGAIENPASARGRSVSTALVELNSLIGETPHDYEPPSTGYSRAKVPELAHELIADRSRRNVLLRGVVASAVNQIRCDDILLALSKTDSRLFVEVKNASARLILEIVRLAAFAESLDLCSDSLSRAGVQVQSLISADLPFSEICLQLGRLLPLPWRVLDKRSLLFFVQNGDLRAKLASMSEMHLRCTMKRIEYFFSAASPLGRVYQCVGDELAHLDALNLLLSDRRSWVDWAPLAGVRRSIGFPLALFSVSSLVAIVPPLAQFVGSVEESLLQRSCRFLASGSCMAAVVEVVVNRLGSEETALTPFTDCKERELFASAVSRMSQEEIFQQNKESLIRKVRGCGGSDRTILDELKSQSESAVKSFLSRCRAEVSNSYIGSVFDQLSLETGSTDVLGLLPLEEQRVLLSRIKEFQGSILSPETELRLTKADILNRLCVTSLCGCLSNLNQDQIEEILDRLQSLLAGSLYPHVFRECLAEAGLERQGGEKFTLLQMDRLVKQLLTLPPSCTSLTPVAYHLSDIETRELLQDLNLPEKNLAYLVTKLHEALPDLGATELFIQLASESSDIALFESLGAVFGHHRVRTETIRLAQQLLEAGYTVEKLNHLLPEGCRLCDQLCAALQDSHGALKAIPLQRRQVQLLRHFDNALMTEAAGVFKAVFGSLCFSATLNVFYAVARNVRTFDVKRYFPRLESRVLLAGLVATHLRENAGARLTRQDFFKNTDGKIHFDRLLDELRTLPALHFNELVSEIVRLLYRDPLGNFCQTLFSHWTMVRNGQFGCDKMIVGVSLTFIQRRNPFDLESKLDGFDSKAFCSRRDESKFSVWKKLLSSDELVGRAAAWSEPQTEEVFAFLKSRLFPRSRQVAGSQMTELAAHRHQLALRSVFVTSTAVGKFKKLAHRPFEE